MSDFEQTVKPLLTPAIRGEPVKWATAAEQKIVARWAFKTALMVDRSQRPSEWTAPDRHFKYLYEHREPPASSSIFLAHYAPQPGEVFYAAWAGTAWTAAGGDFSSRDKIHGFRVTFSVGHAIFRTYGHSRDDEDGFVMTPFLALGDQLIEDTYRQLWPLQPRPHEWPPQGANFATSALVLLEPSPKEGGPQKTPKA